MPAGGIMPARTFRITFSHVAADFGASLTSRCSSDRSAVRVRSLWQVTQYFVTTAACGEAEADSVTGFAAVAWAGAWADPLEAATTAMSQRTTAEEILVCKGPEAKLSH
jgi:hypothetical protein